MEPTRPAANTQQIPIDKIVPSPYQARKSFNDQTIQDLAKNLKEHGMMVAINVRPIGDQFELIAGERRWRAARLLGWPTIEAKIENVDDKEAAERVLIENVQREDLSAIEQALAYKRLAEAPFNLNQSQIARQISKDRTLVNKYFAVSELCNDRGGVNRFTPLSLSHLLEICRLSESEERARLADDAVEKELSVEQLKALVDRTLDHGKPAPAHGEAQPVAAVADPLADVWQPLQLQTRVTGKLWGVSYGPRQIPEMKGVTMPAWHFWMANNGLTPRSELRRWFLQMAEALGDTREEQALMEKHGIKVMGSSLGDILAQAGVEETISPEAAPAAPETDEELDPKIAAMIARRKAQRMLPE